jgi:hypothetical protein
VKLTRGFVCGRHRVVESQAPAGTLAVALGGGVAAVGGDGEVNEPWWLGELQRGRVGLTPGGEAGG